MKKKIANIRANDYPAKTKERMSLNFINDLLENDKITVDDHKEYKQKILKNRICGAKAKQTGLPCTRAPVTGRKRCKIHGGASPWGSDHYNFKEKGYSHFLPKKLTERYDSLIQNPDITSLRNEISLIEARLTELIENIDNIKNRHFYDNLKKAYDNWQKASKYDQENEEYCRALFEEKLFEMSDSYSVWDEISRLSDLKRKLASAERQKVKELKQAIPTDQVVMLLRSTIESARNKLKQRKGQVIDDDMIEEVRKSIAHDVSKMTRE